MTRIQNAVDFLAHLPLRALGFWFCSHSEKIRRQRDGKSGQECFRCHKFFAFKHVAQRLAEEARRKEVVMLFAEEKRFAVQQLRKAGTNG